MTDTLSGPKKMIGHKGIAVGHGGAASKSFKEGFDENFYDRGQIV